MKQQLIQTITMATLEALLAQARQAPRRRAIQRLHDDDWEHAHRMLNALMPGTYVRPHRHSDKYKGEGFVLLRGRVAVLIFDEAGALNQAASCVLSHADGCFGVDIPPGVWHALVALEEGPTMMSNIVECDVQRVHIGMAVSVVFEQRAGEAGKDAVAVPQFRPGVG